MTATNTLLLANSLVDFPVLGKGLKSPLTVNTKTGDFATVSGSENLAQCLRDLITTPVGESLMSEDFGVALPLFDDPQALIDILPHKIIEAITKYEPRVQNVRVVAQEGDPGEVLVRVTYVERATGSPGTLVYPYLTSGRLHDYQ